MKKLRCPFTVAALLVLSVIPLCHLAHAQSTASIEGQVNDQNGAIVPAVEITVVSPEMGISRVAVTDDDGQISNCRSSGWLISN